MSREELSISNTPSQIKRGTDKFLKDHGGVLAPIAKEIVSLRNVLRDPKKLHDHLTSDHFHSLSFKECHYVAFEGVFELLYDKNREEVLENLDLTEEGFAAGIQALISAEPINKKMRIGFEGLGAQFESKDIEELSKRFMAVADKDEQFNASVAPLMVTFGATAGEGSFIHRDPMREFGMSQDPRETASEDNLWIRSCILGMGNMMRIVRRITISIERHKEQIGQNLSDEEKSDLPLAFYRIAERSIRYLARPLASAHIALATQEFKRDLPFDLQTTDEGPQGALLVMSKILHELGLSFYDDDYTADQESERLDHRKPKLAEQAKASGEHGSAQTGCPVLYHKAFLEIARTLLEKHYGVKGSQPIEDQ